MEWMQIYPHFPNSRATLRTFVSKELQNFHYSHKHFRKGTSNFHFCMERLTIFYSKEDSQR